MLRNFAAYLFIIYSIIVESLQSGKSFHYCYENYLSCLNYYVNCCPYWTSCYESWTPNCSYWTSYCESWKRLSCCAKYP